MPRGGSLLHLKPGPVLGERPLMVAAEGRMRKGAFGLVALLAPATPPATRDLKNKQKISK